MQFKQTADLGGMPFVGERARRGSPQGASDWQRTSRCRCIVAARPPSLSHSQSGVFCFCREMHVSGANSVVPMMLMSKVAGLDGKSCYLALMDHTEVKVCTSKVRAVRLCCETFAYTVDFGSRYSPMYQLLTDT